VSDKLLRKFSVFRTIGYCIAEIRKFCDLPYMGVLIERRRLQFVEKLLAGGTIDLSVQTEVVLMCFYRAMQSAVMRLLSSVRLSVCLSVRNDQVP